MVRWRLLAHENVLKAGKFNQTWLFTTLGVSLIWMNMCLQISNLPLSSFRTDSLRIHSLIWHDRE